MSDFEFRTGVMNDKETVHRFLLDHFRTTEPITVSLGSTENDVNIFFTDLATSGLFDETSSILVFKQDELVAICLNSIKSFESSSKICGRLTFDPHRDFQYEIENGAYESKNANKLSAFVDVMEQDLQILLGSPKKIFKIDVLCVSKTCQGQGIARRLVEQSLMIAEKENCEHVATVATACASQAIFRKLGLETIRELPFSCFRCNGEVVYRDLLDGGVSGKLMVTKLNNENIGLKLGAEEEDDEDLR